jgi:hypothetical protein
MLAPGILSGKDAFCGLCKKQKESISVPILEHTPLSFFTPATKLFWIEQHFV